MMRPVRRTVFFVRSRDKLEVDVLHRAEDSLGIVLREGMFLSVKRKFLVVILLSAVIFVVVLIRTSLVIPRYSIDTTSRETLQASVVEILQGELIENEDHHKFYLLLVESEAGTELDPKALLAKYDIPHVEKEEENLGLSTITRLEYKDFRDGIYTGGFNLSRETKRLKITYAEVREVYVEKGETLPLFGNDCPTGWTHVEDDVLRVTCQSEETGVHLLALWEESSVQTFRSGYFERRFHRPQTLYGYEDTYNPYLSFTYRTHIPTGFFGPFTGNFITPLATITLIDDDKLHIA